MIYYKLVYIIIHVFNFAKVITNIIIIYYSLFNSIISNCGLVLSQSFGYYYIISSVLKKKLLTTFYY